MGKNEVYQISTRSIPKEPLKLKSDPRPVGEIITSNAHTGVCIDLEKEFGFKE
jgi:hypothetical protein